jgi:hypothetical protein
VDNILLIARSRDGLDCAQSVSTYSPLGSCRPATTSLSHITWHTSLSVGAQADGQIETSVRNIMACYGDVYGAGLLLDRTGSRFPDASERLGIASY